MAEKLSDAKLRALKATGKAEKYSDGGGLYIFLSKAGGKLWRYDYRFGHEQKRKTLSLGKYPDVGLKEARERHRKAKELLAQGIDPGEQRKAEKAEAEEEALTFERVARDWHKKQIPRWKETHAKQVLQRLENMIFPEIGNRPVKDLCAADYLAVAQKAEERGRYDLAHRLARLCGQITRYAKRAGIVATDEASGLGEALTAKPTEHHPAITDPVEVGALLRAIDDYPGDVTTRYALKILPYVFVRSGELRGACWEEIDLDAGLWTIPAERMKKHRPHIVPLAEQVKQLFLELKEYTGGRALAFPSAFSATRCLSDVGLLNALRRMGYGKDVMCVHGFRGMASTLLNELGTRPDVIEYQLAHIQKNAVRAAYNHAEYMEERRRMMQAWADYLDALKAGADPSEAAEQFRLTGK